ncbi:MAG: DUF946 domain-containing protein [candidate division Zixibacteria bacterium]|nr:DUF946 domain-containing protein [candidate division Zixibacteria bacterium]
MRYTILIWVAVLMLVCGCDSDKATQPVQEGSIYLSRLVVSMVPGRTETVKVISTSGGQCEATCDDPAIATATIIDSSLMVTGVAYGRTNITVIDGMGNSRVLPVQVYDHSVLETDELLISFTDEFEHIFTHSPPGWQPISFWRPIPPAGFSILGTYIHSGGDNPNGRAAVMVVQDKPGTQSIAITSNFQQAGNVLYNPVAPSGYKALGQVVASQGNSPDPVACIREDLTTAGDCYLFWSHENNNNQFESAWNIYQPNADLHENAYLAPGMAIYVSGIDNPEESHPSVNVLNVTLPMLDEAPSQEYVPSLRSYGEPTDGLAPRMEKAMLVPCTIVKDAAYNDDMPWRIANSPFYRLERQVYYKYINHYDNRQGSMPQSFHWEISCGINATQSQTIWSETGVELSMEAGVSIYAFEGKITATVSRSFGYERMNSITELQSNTLTIDVNVPPNKSAALWQRYNRYVLYRHNGTELEPVTDWECGINSYVVDEYPDE